MIVFDQAEYVFLIRDIEREMPAGIAFFFMSADEIEESFHRGVIPDDLRIEMRNELDGSPFIRRDLREWQDSVVTYKFAYVVRQKIIDMLAEMYEKFPTHMRNIKIKSKWLAKASLRG